MSNSVVPTPTVSRRQFVAGLGVGVSALSTWGVKPLFRSDGLPDERPVIVGHRGAEGLAPPNTRAAIRRALETGVDGVELDVWRTADDELILFHDPVLDWDSTGHGWIENRSWDEIEGVRIDGEPLITFAEALEELESTDVEIYLELKEGGYTDAVLDVAAEYGVLDRLTVISFDRAALESAQRIGVSTGLVGSAPTPWIVDDALDADADVVMSHYAPHAASEFLDEAREADLVAGLWKLVETKETLRDAIEVGPDVLITNYPNYAIDILDGR